MRLVSLFVLVMFSVAMAQTATRPVDLAKVITSIPAKLKVSPNESERQTDARNAWIADKIIGKPVTLNGSVARYDRGILTCNITMPKELGSGEVVVTAKVDAPTEKMYSGDTLKMSGTIQVLTFSTKIKGFRQSMTVSVTLESAIIESVKAPKK